MKVKSVEKDGDMLRKWHIASDGKIVIETIQDADEILKANRDARNSGDGYTKSRNMKHIGRVPTIFIHKWLKESGLRYGTREFMEYIKKKLNNSDFSAFRVSEGRY